MTKKNTTTYREEISDEELEYIINPPRLRFHLSSMTTYSLEEKKNLIIDNMKRKLLSKEVEVPNRLYRRACVYCAKSYNTYIYDMIFCCVKCNDRYLYKRLHKHKDSDAAVCVICGKSFILANKRSTCCSEECRKLQARKDKRTPIIETEKKKRKTKSLKELMFIQEKQEKARLFNDTTANNYIRTGRGFNL